MTRCAKCDSGYFTLEVIEPAGSGFKLNAVQCSSCGAPFGVVDYYNLGQLLKNQEKSIANLESKVDSMAHTLNQIAYALNQSMRR